MSDVGGMTPKDNDETLETVLRSIGPIDRRLWAWAFRRALRSPSNRFYFDLPKRGLRGAAYNLLSTFWAVSALIGFVGVGTQFLPNRLAADVLTSVLIAFTLLCGPITAVEAFRTSRYSRAFRADAESGSRR